MSIITGPSIPTDVTAEITVFQYVPSDTVVNGSPVLRPQETTRTIGYVPLYPDVKIEITKCAKKDAHPQDVGCHRIRVNIENGFVGFSSRIYPQGTEFIGLGNQNPADFTIKPNCIQLFVDGKHFQQFHQNYQVIPICEITIGKRTGIIALMEMVFKTEGGEDIYYRPVIIPNPTTAIPRDSITYN